MIQPIARRVEESDPRMELRKDESGSYGGEKRQGKSEEVQALPWEDTTTISTFALANFLTALLGEAAAPTQSQAEQPDQPLPPEHHEPVNTYVSRATHAYQATGRAVHDNNIGEPVPNTQGPIDPETTVMLGADIGEEERARIRGFILDLQDLDSKDVKEVMLQRTLNFLDAIEQSIKDARALI